MWLVAQLIRASIFGMPYVFENEDHQKAIFDAMMNNDPAVSAITDQFIADADKLADVAVEVAGQ